MHDERSLQGRLVKIRLTDIPLEHRLAAYARLQRRLADEGGAGALLETVELLRAARYPSDTVHRVSEQAWLDLMGA